MNSILIINYSFQHHRRWLTGVIDYFRNHFGADVYLLSNHYHPRWLRFFIKHVDAVLLWNGSLPRYEEARCICSQSNTPYCICEVGYFPQKWHIVFDRSGINARSALNDKNLDAVDESLLEKYRDFMLAYRRHGEWTGGGGYTFCPLQLAHDSNIVHHSPFSNMQDFIDYMVCRHGADRPIFFKVHPKDTSPDYAVPAPHRLLKSGNLFSLICHAEQVVGINSTVLLEAAVVGAPVSALGDGFVKSADDNLPAMLALLHDQQAPILQDDFSYWLTQYGGMQLEARSGTISRLCTRCLYIGSVLASTIKALLISPDKAERSHASWTRSYCRP